MSIKSSLRKIYTALGGTDTNSKTITGLLDDISTVATPGGGGEIMVVTFTNGESSSITYTADKNWQDVKDAFEEGVPVIGILHKFGTPFDEYEMLNMQQSMNFITGDYKNISMVSNTTKLFWGRLDWTTNGVTYTTGQVVLAS